MQGHYQETIAAVVSCRTSPHCSSQNLAKMIFFLMPVVPCPCPWYVYPYPMSNVGLESGRRPVACYKRRSTVFLSFLPLCPCLFSVLKLILGRLLSPLPRLPPSSHFFLLRFPSISPVTFVFYSPSYMSLTV